MAPTTTTTATVTVGGGTTVDNLNVLDAIKTNDTNGVEYIYWSDISTFLTTSTNATQSQTIQQEFSGGQLFLTFSVSNSYYTIGYSTATQKYFVELTDALGHPTGSVDTTTGLSASASLYSALTGTNSLFSALTNLGFTS